MDAMPDATGHPQFLDFLATCSRDRLPPGVRGLALTKVIDTGRRLVAIFAADVSEIDLKVRAALPEVGQTKAE